VDARTYAAAIEEELDAIIELTGRMVAIDSPTDSPEGVEAVCAVLAEAARHAGCEVELQPLAGCGPILDVRLRLGDGATILVLGHSDTVWPVGTVATWPFRVDSGWLYGPGVGDMKCCLATAVHAIGALGRARPPGLGTVRLLVVPDEERGSTGSRSVIEAAAREATACLVLEAARPGGGLVTGRGAVGAMRVVAIGIGRHVTEPGERASALAPLAALVAPIEQLATGSDGGQTSVGLLLAGTARQIVPERGEMLVDLRATTTARAEELAGAIRSLVGAMPLAAGVTLSVDGGVTRPAWQRDSGSAGLYALAVAAGDELGVRVHELFERGGSDASLAGATGTPTLDGLGPISRDSCSREERVEIAGVPHWGAILASVAAAAALRPPKGHTALTI
jgi:glutamate carboxypeptidase